MKIHIFGASASGVTTLGVQLSKELKVPYYDSDEFFWLKTAVPFTAKRDPKIRNKMISEQLNNNQDFILGGSIIHWGENVFPDFDLIVFLYLSPKIRMERLKSREMQRYGEIIILDPERKEQYEKFIAWAEDYDHDSGIAERTFKAHKEWLSIQENSRIIEITKNLEVSEKIQLILEEIKKLS